MSPPASPALDPWATLKKKAGKKAALTPSTLTADIRLGDGANIVAAVLDGYEEARISTDTGKDADQVDVDLRLPAEQITRAAVAANVGAGDDLVNIKTVAADGDFGDDAVVDVDFQINLDRGNSELSLDFEGNEARTTTRLDITGEGNHTTDVALRKKVSKKAAARPSTLTASVNLSGKGDNNVLLNVENYEDTSLTLQGGNGKEDADINVMMPMAPMARAAVTADGRGGDDRVEIISRPSAGILPDESFFDISYQVLLEGGDDEARFKAVGDLFQVDVSGGGGSDFIHGNVELLGKRQLPAGLSANRQALSQIKLDGGLKQDKLALDIGGAIHGHAGLNIDVTGGASDDDAIVRYSGQVDGQLSVRLDGDKGHDRIAALLDIAPESLGSISAEVLGKGGNDQLALLASDVATGNLLVDGGRGSQDLCLATDNVFQVNCEGEVGNPEEFLANLIAILDV